MKINMHKVKSQLPKLGKLVWEGERNFHQCGQRLENRRQVGPGKTQSAG